ncbi:aminoglycoside phosphotransferase family protein [Paenibacillus sp. 1001270B_150601_E10]|uniref:aminoglycoside phosphotransferase family protein n=1 Tax=Paenibacillus sp. 1001270B_150601_E10 TaxID=2787079 RepID=UPI00189DCBB2|nr:aminoglycoside phosphotransferase family protein [Paenibacillus sp. 1001270B_150601_E10]
MVEIQVELVKQLIHDQFPQWSMLSIRPVEKGGHDNRTFHLGDTMTVRLPSGAAYAPQVEKELFWLPKLKPFLSLPISSPIAKGKPTVVYPFPWLVNEWLPGDTVSRSNISDLEPFAADLAHFLIELQAIDAAQGPLAGEHNFHRGGDLIVYNNETEAALSELSPALPTEQFHEIWSIALASHWSEKGVWVHGDIAPGNLLVHRGLLCGVIDFGILGVGDPACDYAMAWTFFDRKSRMTFKDALGCDEGTWNRARGWALWKALITYAGPDQQSERARESKHTLDAILEEYEQDKK